MCVAYQFSGYYLLELINLLSATHSSSALLIQLVVIQLIQLAAIHLVRIVNMSWMTN